MHQNKFKKLKHAYIFLPEGGPLGWGGGAGAGASLTTAIGGGGGGSGCSFGSANGLEAWLFDSLSSAVEGPFVSITRLLVCRIPSNMPLNCPNLAFKCSFSSSNTRTIFLSFLLLDNDGEGKGKEGFLNFFWMKILDCGEGDDG